MRSRSVLFWLVLAAAIAAGVGTKGSFGDSDGTGAAPREGQVTRVVDGDTIHVEWDGHDETVRYIGVDTPESVKPRTPVQCYAKTASHFNEQLVAGKRVKLVTDREQRDRYGRLLAYVYRAKDGAFVNARLVEGGYAKTLEIAPNTRFASRFSALETKARAQGRGLWTRCAR